MGISFRRAIAPVCLLLLAGCSVSAPSTREAAGGVHFYAISSEPTAEPTSQPSNAAPPAATATPTALPTATPTIGPVTYALDFRTERRDLTMHVGETLELSLGSGVTGPWISGVDDARVLAPVSAGANGIYQARLPGTTLVTAHLLVGCANVSPGAPCKPERGLWYQMRVYVLA